MISYDRLLAHRQVIFTLSEHFIDEIAGTSLLGFLWSKMYSISIKQMWEQWGLQLPPKKPHPLVHIRWVVKSHVLPQRP